MSNLRVVKIVALLYQVILAVPLLGGAIVVSTGWQALTVAFFIHLIVFILALKNNGAKLASILGMITSVLAWIPVVGWALHTITALLYAYEVFIRNK